MEVLALQRRVYLSDGSINITNTSILPRCKYSYYKHEYITQMEVLTLQTRVYNPVASIHITSTSILPRWKY